jgi:hypothetical protein
MVSAVVSAMPKLHTSTTCHLEHQTRWQQPDTFVVYQHGSRNYHPVMLPPTRVARRDAQQDDVTAGSFRAVLEMRAGQVKKLCLKSVRTKSRLIANVFPSAPTKGFSRFFERSRGESLSHARLLPHTSSLLGVSTCQVLRALDEKAIRFRTRASYRTRRLFSSLDLSGFSSAREKASHSKPYFIFSASHFLA